MSQLLLKPLAFVFLRCATLFLVVLSGWNAYLFKSGATTAFGFLERVVLPSLVTAFTLTLIHFLVAKGRGVQTDFTVRQKAQVVLPDQALDLNVAASLISKAKNWTLVESNRDEAVFKTRLNPLFSFGEVIRLKLTGKHVTISSKPLVPFTAIDFGQNALNVKTVADLLTAAR